MRQLRAENGVSGFGVLFQGVGRDWGTRQAAQDKVGKQRTGLYSQSQGSSPEGKHFETAFVLTRHL